MWSRVGRFRGVIEGHHALIPGISSHGKIRHLRPYVKGLSSDS